MTNLKHQLLITIFSLSLMNSVNSFATDEENENNSTNSMRKQAISVLEKITSGLQIRQLNIADIATVTAGNDASERDLPIQQYESALAQWRSIVKTDTN